MRNSIRNIGAGLALTGAVLTGAGCANGKETPKKETKPALSTDQKLAMQALDLTSAYLKDSANGGSSVSAILDTDKGKEFHGGVFGNKDLCSTSWDNKIESIKTGADSEGRIVIDVDKSGKESLYVMVVGERPDGTYAAGSVMVKALNQTCELPGDPEEVVKEAVRLIKNLDSEVTFQKDLENTDNAKEAIASLEEATQ